MEHDNKDTELTDFEFEDSAAGKKQNYTIRMNIRFDKAINQEEAERRLYAALHGIGVRTICGGIK